MTDFATVAGLIWGSFFAGIALAWLASLAHRAFKLDQEREGR